MEDGYPNIEDMSPECQSIVCILQIANLYHENKKGIMDNKFYDLLKFLIEVEVCDNSYIDDNKYPMYHMDSIEYTVWSWIKFPHYNKTCIHYLYDKCRSSLEQEIKHENKTKEDS